MQLHDLGTMLFVGDSVTDCERTIDPRGIGNGYVAAIARALGPTGPRIVNRGVNGDRLVDLERRWTDDVLAHRADLVSVLIGINDTWHWYRRGEASPLPEFEARYDRLMATLVGTRIVLVEPFVLPVSPDQEGWRPELDERIAVVHRMAERWSATVVSTDRELRERAAEVGAATLAEDGVHPTPEGHRLIAALWLDSVRGA